MEEGTSTTAAGKLVAKALRKRGMKGILPSMADRDQLVELLCEMPECYCPKGRGYFEKKSNPMRDWAPNVDHSPIPKWKGGKLKPTTFAWRTFAATTSTLGGGRR